MSLQRMCDVCGNWAQFTVGKWDVDAESLIETADVCGIAHASDQIEAWLIADTPAGEEVKQ